MPFENFESLNTYADQIQSKQNKTRRRWCDLRRLIGWNEDPPFEKRKRSGNGKALDFFTRVKDYEGKRSIPTKKIRSLKGIGVLAKK